MDHSKPKTIPPSATKASDVSPTGRVTMPLPPPRGPRILLGVFALLALVIVAAGYASYRRFEQDTRSDVERELTIVSNIKTDVIEQWRNERMGDGAVLFRNTAFAEAVGRQLDDPDDLHNSDELRRWLHAYEAYGQYDGIYLLDATGAVRFAELTVKPPSAPLARAAMEARQAGTVRLLDFYEDAPGEVHLALLVPMFRDEHAAEAESVIVLRIEPDRYLHPLLERWPGVSTTAESALVRRDGDGMLFLSALHADAEAPLKRRIPLSNERAVVARALRGDKGVIEGDDYRGEPCLAVIEPIDASPWVLVTTISSAEVQQHMRGQLALIAAFGALLLAVAGTSLSLGLRALRERVAQQRRNLSTALAESEERLRLALSASAQGLYDLDLRTGKVVVTPEYATMLGHDPATFEVTYESWQARIHPDDRARTMAIVDDYLAGRRATYATEFRLRHKDGGYRWILSVGKVFSRNAEGEPLRMLGTHTDITDRKLAEERSSRRAQLYAALNQCNEAIVRATDRAALFQQICETIVAEGGVALAWTGRVDAERGRIVPEGSCCLPPKKLGAIELPLAPAAPEAKSPVGMVIESGKPIWIEDITAAPVLDALFRDATGLERGAAGLLPLIHDGQVARILFLFVRDPALLDLDARRIFVQMASDLSFALDGFAKEAHKGEIEANLRESEERYRTMFAEAMLPLLLTDPESGRIVDGNRAALAFYGYSHDELTSMRIWEINMLGREAVLEKLHAAEEGKERRFSFVHRLKSGELRDVEVYSAIIRVAGERRVQSSVIDVTARNRAEQAVQRSLAEKESLLQEVHHRVKNNLQVMSSLLRMEGRRTSSAEARAMIGEMQGRILSMALLHETLYRSRDFAEVDLSAYLGRLAEQLLRAAAPGGTIKLALNLAPAQIGLDQAIPCGLLANELMSNSLKHAFPGGRRGTLTIDLAREGEGGALVLRVSDDGVGLSPDAEARSQRSLGLTLVHDLTRQLQGTLEIDGARGVSSTLRFTPSITRTKG